MINLDPRLKAVLNEIKPCEVIADIGADHGKIAVSAKLNGLAKKVIASDISEPSIAKARDLAIQYGAEVFIRVGEGITTLSIDEYDTVIIAGMGGIEISSILTKANKKFNRYIFAPHTKAYELRKFLSVSGVKPIRDYKVFSKGKYYDIISAEVGEYKPSNDVLYYGYHENTPIFSEFCQKERARLKKIIESGGEKRNAEMLETLEQIMAENCYDEQVRK